MKLEGKNILVVGLGRSGQAACRLCKRAGAAVRATDKNTVPDGAGELAALGVGLSLGHHSSQDFERADIIVLSPGVDPRMPQIVEARAMGKEIIGELELGFRFLNCPSVMITGTNGKSTVTTLIGDMLQRSGMRTFTGGNLGYALCDFVLDDNQADWAVLEVSSFQCDTSKLLKPEVGVLLNITPDHLDRYERFEDYAESKFCMFKRQGAGDSAVFLAGDPEIAKRAASCAAEVWYFSKQGGYRPGGRIQDKELVISGPDGKEARIDTSKSRLGGDLMRLNYLAAAIAASICGAPAQAIEEAISQFGGLPHRMQHLGKLKGVDYINDSKGTNLGAVIAALESVTQPVVLLLGGQDKKGAFAQLTPHLQKDVRAVICFGQAGPALFEQLRDFDGLSLEPDLQGAFNRARTLAQEGDAVLLSPGCTSWDAYNNYGERGDHFFSMFREAVSE